MKAVFADTSLFVAFLNRRDEFQVTAGGDNLVAPQ